MFFVLAQTDSDSDVESIYVLRTNVAYESTSKYRYRYPEEMLYELKAYRRLTSSVMAPTSRTFSRNRQQSNNTRPLVERVARMASRVMYREEEIAEPDPVEVAATNERNRLRRAELYPNHPTYEQARDQENYVPPPGKALGRPEYIHRVVPIERFTRRRNNGAVRRRCLLLVFLVVVVCVIAVYTKLRRDREMNPTAVYLENEVALD